MARSVRDLGQADIAGAIAELEESFGVGFEKLSGGLLDFFRPVHSMEEFRERERERDL